MSRSDPYLLRPGATTRGQAPGSPAPRAAATVVVLIVALTLGAAQLGGCSRVKLVYAGADLLLAHYAADYLGLDADRMALWEPRLDQAIAAHRRDELPVLAGWIDAVRAAAVRGFPEPEARCLVLGSARLYRDHARLAVDLAAPLLADLTQARIAALESRFAKDLALDRPKPGDDRDREARKRSARYAEAIEYWTGPLSGSQKGLVAEIAARMPDTGAPVLAYRTRKRDGLIALLRSGAGESGVRTYLADWLVDYRDLPPELERARPVLIERLVELVHRLGTSLDARQRAHLKDRLESLHQDLLELQRVPRQESPGC